MWYLAGNDILRPRRRSLATGSTSKLLSLAEAQERERAQSASDAYFEVGGGPSAIPANYHTVLDFPKRLLVASLCCCRVGLLSCSSCVFFFFVQLLLLSVK